MKATLEQYKEVKLGYELKLIGDKEEEVTIECDRKDSMDLARELTKELFHKIAHRLIDFNYSQESQEQYLKILIEELVEETLNKEVDFI